MKKLFFSLLLLLLSFWGYSQQPTAPQGSYRNPLFAGDYPDPSILRNCNDYYIVSLSPQQGTKFTPYPFFFLRYSVGEQPIILLKVRLK